MNYSTIEVCERGEWREICDRTFTQEDAQVVCHQLGFSAIRKLAHNSVNCLVLYMHVLQVQLLVTSVRDPDRLPLVSLQSVMVKK